MGEDDDAQTTATQIMKRAYALMDDPATRTRGPRPNDGQPGRATRVHAPPPTNLAALDLRDTQAAELRQHVRAHADDTLPARPRGMADWYEYGRERTSGSDQQILDAMAWRHAAEAALLLDHRDQRMIREQSCPTCGCWGLTWDHHTRRVVCINRYCTPESGVGATTWTLQKLAEHAIRRRPARRTAH